MKSQYGNMQQNFYNDKKTKNDETIHGMIDMTLTTPTDYISCITDNERWFCGLGSIILLSALEYLYTTRCLFKNCNANQLAIPPYPYKFLEYEMEWNIYTRIMEIDARGVVEFCESSSVLHLNSHIIPN